jgi:hypothetical protein
MPEIVHQGQLVTLFLPREDSDEFGTVQEQWDVLQDWLYPEDEEGHGAPSHTAGRGFFISVPPPPVPGSGGVP